MRIIAELERGAAPWVVGSQSARICLQGRRGACRAEGSRGHSRGDWHRPRSTRRLASLCRAAGKLWCYCNTLKILKQHHIAGPIGCSNATGNSAILGACHDHQ
jgi:hypothetical protein